MGSFFGGKDPFDHLFSTQPFGGLFGGKGPFDDFTGAFDNPFFNSPFDNHSGSRKQITIEELSPENDGGHNALQSNVPSKEVSVESSNDYPTGTQSFSFQRTAYGGLDGCSLAKIFQNMMWDAANLKISNANVLELGHSVTTKQFSNGKVNSMQTLHNLQEDELTGFQENWKMNADKVLPGWNDGFNLLENAGVNSNAWGDFFGRTGLGLYLENLGNNGAQWDGESQVHLLVVLVDRFLGIDPGAVHVTFLDRLFDLQFLRFLLLVALSGLAVSLQAHELNKKQNIEIELNRKDGFGERARWVFKEKGEIAEENRGEKMNNIEENVVGVGVYVSGTTKELDQASRLKKRRTSDLKLAAKVFDVLSPPFYALYFVVGGFLGPYFVYRMFAFYLSGLMIL
ncbi:hypothetical protein PHJA_001645200 [Phtheirospermum japonicum]|uniref:Uncharacterized protein n=1 Tax=Phtheirospermum japonicum TaxID=374723 RepID=A0A830CDA3_9LAMI|nr:hypothetical protein PHJA_001645200 [Phtheirospermum japonicum]